jgi:hypothetical protein
VTHCDNLMQEKRGITHINMTDLLQQYSIGNGEILSQSSTYKARPTGVRISNSYSQHAARTPLVATVTQLIYVTALKFLLLFPHSKSCILKSF